MLLFTNYNIVFREIPDEVTLAINISNCPNRCKGCHSPYLMENGGEVLDEESLTHLYERYEAAITCVCFMGGDANPKEVERLSGFLHKKTNGILKTGWYSGRNYLPVECSPQYFNYIKLGEYIESLGGLDSDTTNQRFYRIEAGKMIDMTSHFHRKP